MSPIRLLIADDQLLMREGLRTVLSPAQGIEIVGEAQTGDEAVAQSCRLAPDVILMDLNMTGTDGIAATREILREQPGIKIVGLTAQLEDDRVVEAVQAGAAGIWIKDVDLDDLLRVIRSAYAGERPIHPAAMEKLIQARRATYIDRLSTRERDVLAWLGKGLSNRDIAKRLTLSEATVKGHVSHILAKLGVKNRAQVALYAARYKDK